MTASRLQSIVPLMFFVAVIITALWQIETNFKDQGIASGGPYDNAASFPRAVVFIMGVVITFQAIIDFRRADNSKKVSVVKRSDFMRAVLMLITFAIYLSFLDIIGYHLATSPMIFSVMWICGTRKYIILFFAPIVVATLFAFVFEVLLNVVLPLGIWSIFIPW